MRSLYCKYLSNRLYCAVDQRSLQCPYLTIEFMVMRQAFIRLDDHFQRSLQYTVILILKCMNTLASVSCSQYRSSKPMNR